MDDKAKPGSICSQLGRLPGWWRLGIPLLLTCGMFGWSGCKPTVDPNTRIQQRAATWPPYRAPTVAAGFETPAWTPMTRRERKPLKPVLDARIPVVKPYQDWNLEETAMDALARIGQPAVPELVKALSHSEPQVRRQAVEVIGRIGPTANEAVSALVDTLDSDADEDVRKAAVRALGQIGPDAGDAVKPLMRLIDRAADQAPSL